MYSFNEYLLAKYNNSILDRFERLCNALTTMLSMPVVIAGLHTKFKNAVSGVERDLKDICPRCILTFNGIAMDKNACTSVQASVGMVSANETGNIGDNVIEFRRLPLNAAFSVAIVANDPALAIRLTEYIAMLSFEFPQIPGDEHTVSTLIFNESTSIDNDNDKANYIVNTSLTVNMQILEPMTLPMDDSQYPLVGVGIKRPDGSWDETPKGDIVTNPDTGEPVIDPDTGEPLIGTYVSDGWYRLHIRFHVHSHAPWHECLESDTAIDYDRPSGAEILGDIATPTLPKFNNKTNTIVAD